MLNIQVMRGLTSNWNDISAQLATHERCCMLNTSPHDLVILCKRVVRIQFVLCWCSVLFVCNMADELLEENKIKL